MVPLELPIRFGQEQRVDHERVLRASFVFARDYCDSLDTSSSSVEP
jgi:hypothetical protein